MEKKASVKAVEQALQTVDLDQFDVLERSNEGIEFELLSPQDGAPTGIFLRVLGQDSDAYQEVMWRQQTAKFAQMAAGGGKLEMDAKENAQNALELICACVTSWSVGREPWTGHIVKGGKKLAATPDNVMAILRSQPSFRNQADAQIHNRANFLKGPLLH